MHRSTVRRNLHRDPLTNLKNFIQFIDEDYNGLFGDGGMVCIVKIAGLIEVNKRYGREVGDLMIRTAAHTLCQYFTRQQVYRTEGDAFTIVLKDISEDVEDTFGHVQNHYRQLMYEKGFESFELETAIYAYDEAIESIEDYYMFIMDSRGEIDTDQESREGLVRKILGGVVNRLRLSIEQYEEVYNFALIDEVSGLPNAKAANEYLSKLTTGSSRRSDRYTVLFIDGDDLRKYNDISYETGNEMIRCLGQIIKDTCREEDRIFRWLSGDEFVVMLEGSDSDTGEMLAERIRTNVEAMQTEFMFDTTISVGVASYPMDGRDPDTVIYYAEKANKLAKDQGKNQVVCWRDVDVTAI